MLPSCDLEISVQEGVGPSLHRNMRYHEHQSSLPWLEVLGLERGWKGVGSTLVMHQLASGFRA